MFWSHVDNLLSLFQKNASRLTWDRLWMLCSYNFGTQGQTNRCFSWRCRFDQFCCLKGQLRPINYAQIRRNRHTGGEAVNLSLWQFSWPLVLLLGLVVPLVLVVLLLSILSFWVKSQPKLKRNSSKTLLYHGQHAWYNFYGIDQWGQHQHPCLKPFKAQNFKKCGENGRTKNDKEGKRNFKWNY